MQVTAHRLLLIPLALAACAPGEAPDLDQEPAVRWEEFQARTYREPGPSGVWILDGDVPVSSTKRLKEIWRARYASDDTTLIVHQESGVDARWGLSERHALSYCVSDSFGTDKADVVSAMAAATGAWEAVADVVFEYVPGEDGDCDGSNTDVVFDVNPAPSGATYLARAFFPNEGRSARNILITPDGISPSTEDLTLTGVLRHELGHTLGFRHEHTRPESATCYEDSSWRALTSYDVASVMHYPHCNGTGDWSLELTATDGDGAAALYGAPDGVDPIEPDQAMSLRLMAAETDFLTLDPIEVDENSSVRVAMTGWGDADLYVAFDAVPTLSSYACRPYAADSNESCAVDVPVGATELYVSVHGYTDAAVDLEVAWAGGDPTADDGLDQLDRILGLANTLDADTLSSLYATGSTVPATLLDERAFPTFTDLMDAVTPSDVVPLHTYTGVPDPRPTWILYAANEATFTELDVDMGLDRRAAEGIVDGRPFTTVDEVDAVSYVGPAALDDLADWGEAHMVATDDEIVLEVANTATLEELDEGVPLDARAAKGLVEGRPFADVDAVDAVPYVGPAALEKMLAWGKAHL